MTLVSVAIPTLDAGPRFVAVLAAIANQEVAADVELVVLDSGSRDGTVDAARRAGARVASLAPGTFNHGRARQRLMELTRGAHVAFLTQDAVPTDAAWLRRLLEGFALADDVGVVCGPYLPAQTASVTVRRELHDFWETFGAYDGPRAFRASDVRHDAQGYPVPGTATFFTSANGCVRRSAWERVPFRPVPYAEDQRLALDMLAAGYAKVFHPRAAVVHSHELSPLARFRRTFDEFRALREVYGHVEGLGARATLGRARLEARRDRALLRSEGTRGNDLDRQTLSSFSAHLARALGAGVGTRADRLPPALRRRLSLEGRSTFEPS